MKKEKTKAELEGYWYDYQYFLEKTKEIDKMKEEVQKYALRLRELENNNLATGELDKCINDIIRRQAEEENMLLSIITKKQKIEETIQNIPQPERTILYFKYVRFLTFDQIASRMNYSTKRIYQLHAIALNKFCDVYDG